MNNTTNTEAAADKYLDLRAAALAATVLMLIENNEVLASVAAAKLPAGLEPANIRSTGQKERTTRIRNLLKACGVKMGARGRGVSVKAATGSMCYWTHVRFEGLDSCETAPHSRFECATCLANKATRDKLVDLILTAFPDLGDRSDAMVDHFDFVFTVNGC